MFFKFMSLILFLNGIQLEDVKNEQMSSPSSLEVLYLVPEEQDTVYALNENTMLGITNGWILPADTSLSLNLYLYFDDVDESRLNIFFHSTKTVKTNISLPQSAAKALLYMYFTENTEKCEESKNHQPLEIVEKVASHIYRAQLKNIKLPYSSKPYYICMQQFDTDNDVHNTMRFFTHQGNLS